MLYVNTQTGEIKDFDDIIEKLRKNGGEAKLMVKEGDEQINVSYDVLDDYDDDIEIRINQQKINYLEKEIEKYKGKIKEITDKYPEDYWKFKFYKA